MNIAALPMYDWPEVREVTDAAWRGIRDALRARGVDAPEKLTRRNGDMPAVPGGIRDASGAIIAPDPATLPPDELDLATLWRHPNLLFAQACWGPIETAGLGAHVRVVGQPDYSGFEGGHGKDYSSALVMRRGDTPPSGLPAISPSRGEIGCRDAAAFPAERLQSADFTAPLPLHLLRGRRLAYNGVDSMSGIIALGRDLEAMGESLDIFSEKVETGGHRASLLAVAQGRADICALDCRSWAMAQQFEPAARDAVVVGWTSRRTGLPYVTAAAMPDEVVAAMQKALSGASFEARSARTSG